MLISTGPSENAHDESRNRSCQHLVESFPFMVMVSTTVPPSPPSIINMRRTAPSLVTAAAVILPAVTAQAPSVIAVGPNGSTCPPALETTTYVAPAVYSSFFETAGTIFNFMGGTNSLVINNVPTTVVTTSYITTTVVQTGLGPSMTSNTIFTRPTNPTSFTQVPPPPTGSSQPITITTVGPNGQTSTITTAQAAPTLGQGVASGTVSQIPQTSPILLAFSYNFEPAARVKRFADPRVKRQTSGEEMVADGYVDGTSQQGATTPNCGYAGRYYLTQGQLLGVNGGNVGRNVSDTYAVFAATAQTHQINTVFTFVNGILQWNSPDAGPATFYQCGSGMPAPLFAGFSSPPFSNCTGVQIGAIAAADCPIDLTNSGQGQTSTSGGSNTASSAISSGSSISSVSQQSGQSSATSSGPATSTPGSNTASSVSSALSTSTGSSPVSSPSASVPVVCPGQNNQVVDGYEILCGRGGFGHNIAGTGAVAPSLDACVQRCTNTAGCVGASYQNDVQNGACYLYDAWYSPNNNQTMYDTAVLVADYDPSSGSSAPTTASSPTGTATGVSSSNAAATSVSSPLSSITGISGVTSSGALPSGTTSSAQSTATSAVCPGSGGQVVNGYYIFCNAGGNGMNINLDPLPAATSFEDCLQICSQTSNCVGASYENDVTAGNKCYLYSTFSGPTGQTNYDTGVLRSAYQPSGSSSVSSPATGSSLSSNGGTTLPITTVTGNTNTGSATSSGSSSTASAICPNSGGQVVNGYYIFCNAGGNGMNINLDPLPAASSFQDCLQICSQTSNCVGASYQNDVTAGNKCYLYSSFSGPSGQTTYDTGVLNSYYHPVSGTTTSAAATSSSSGIVVSPTTIVTPTTTIPVISISGTTTSNGASSTASDICPSQNGQLYNGYRVYCNAGGNGVNLPGSRSAANLQDCIQICSNTAGCVGATHEQNQLTNGACYLYSTFTGTNNGQSGYDTAALVAVDTPSSVISSPTSTTSATPVLPTTPSNAATTTSSASGLATGNPCPNYDGKQYQNFMIDCEGPIQGNNSPQYPSGQQNVASLQDCLSICQQLNDQGYGCTGASYGVQSQYCYPQVGGVAEGAADSNYQGAIYNGPAPTASPSPTTTTATPTQPTFTDTPCQATFTGDPDFQIKCGRAINGNNINPGGTSVGTFDECIALCRAASNCVSLSYENTSGVNNPGGHECYLHDSDTGYNTDLGYNSAVKIGAGSTVENE